MGRLPVSLGAAWSYAINPATSDRDDPCVLQGLMILRTGMVVAHGDTSIVDHLVHDPGGDRALIHLPTNVDSSIPPVSLSAIDPGLPPRQASLWAAGYPADLRHLRDDGLE